jgi:hypothetical protein
VSPARLPKRWNSAGGAPARQIAGLIERRCLEQQVGALERIDLAEESEAVHLRRGIAGFSLEARRMLVLVLDHLHRAATDA